MMGAWIMANEKTLNETAIVAEENKGAGLDFSNLENALQGLTAHDYTFAERACRTAGDTTVEISFSSNFRGRLAAAALKVPYSQIEALSIKEYAAVTLRVGNFLLSSLAEA